MLTVELPGCPALMSASAAAPPRGLSWRGILTLKILFASTQFRFRAHHSAAMFKGHTIRKRFGQHFWRDPAVIEQMVALINPAINEPLVEVGPGSGALTEPLLQRGARLEVFEIDRDLVRRLQTQAVTRRFIDEGRLRVHCADILSRQWGQGLRSGVGSAGARSWQSAVLHHDPVIVSSAGQSAPC